MRQKEFFGKDSIYCLKQIFYEEKPKNVFIVTGKKSFKCSGAQEKINQITANSTKKVIFNKVFPNPKKEDILKGLKKFREEKFDMIIAIGGGSVIDFSKAIKLFYLQKISERIPLVAIPTTAGSGSEATYFIVYYEEGKKISAGDKKITLPDYSIVDPLLLKKIPRKVIASSAIDALVQSVESYWSVNSTKFSRKIAANSIKLINKNILSAILEKDILAISNLMMGANLSGKAINITKTTACHAFAYFLTSHFGIPHGHAAGLTFGESLEFNLKINKKNCVDQRGPEFVRQKIKEIMKLLGRSSLNGTKNHIKDIMKKIGLETKLSKLGVNKKEIILINKDLNKERLKNNPRKFSQKDIEVVFEKIF